MAAPTNAPTEAAKVPIKALNENGAMSMAPLELELVADVVLVVVECVVVVVVVVLVPVVEAEAEDVVLTGLDESRESRTGE